MNIHVKNYLKNFIPYGIYCHGYEGEWCPFYKSTWNKTIKDYKRIRSECEWKNVCDEDCSNCDEIVSYCSFLDVIEYGDFPLGDGCKICSEKDNYLLSMEELDELIKNDVMLNFYKNEFENIKNRRVNE